MASQYKCDICGKPATVHITKIVDGKKIKVHLCEACAQKASFEALNLPEDIFPKIKKLEQNIIENLILAEDGKICKVCGANLEEIEKGERFCCPSCYDSMKESKLIEILSQLHGASAHKGKTPKKHAIAKIEGNTLDAAIEKAALDILPKDKESLDKIAKIGEKIIAEYQSMSNPKADGETQNLPIEKSPPAECDSREILMRKLNGALADERYEDAAKIRDMLKLNSPKS